MVSALGNPRKIFENSKLSGLVLNKLASYKAGNHQHQQRFVPAFAALERSK